MNCEVCRNSDICKFVYIGEDDKKRNIVLDKLHETDEDGVFRLKCDRYVKIVNKKPAEEKKLASEIAVDDALDIVELAKISELNKKTDAVESSDTESLSTEKISPLQKIEADFEENAAKRPAHKRNKIDREKVVQMYNDKIKPRDIAKRLGCSEQSVYSIMREHMGMKTEEK